jgi:hypothetical protein
VSGKLPARRRDWADIQDAIRALKLPRQFNERLDPSVRDSFCQLWDEVQTVEGDY